MSGEDLLKALMGTQQRAADDPFGIAAQGVLGAAPALQNPYASTGTNLAYAGGSTLLALLLASLAKDSAASENADRAPIRAAFLKGTPEEQASLVKQNDWLSPLQSAVLAQQVERQAKVADATALLPVEHQKTLDSASTNAVVDLQKQEGKALLGGQFVQAGKSAAQLGAESEAAKKTASILAEDQAKKQLIGSSPAVNEEMDKLKKSFESEPEVQKFIVVEGSARALAQALKDNSSVSDQELVRRSIQMIEPGMAVREGEQAAMASSQSIPQAWMGELSKALSGGTKLREEVREGIKRLAMRAYESNKFQYDRALDFYSKQARDRNVDPVNISRIGKSLDTSSIFGDAPTAPPSGVPPGFKATGRTAGGKPTYISPDGIEGVLN